MEISGTEVSDDLLIELILLTFLASLVASIAGTGGGSLFIPVYSLAFPDDVHRAVPLSKAAVVGTALGACLVNVLSGSTRKQMINYQLVTLIQPATLLGCLFGVLLNLWMSSVYISAALILILGSTAYKTFKAASNLSVMEKRSAGQNTPRDYSNTYIELRNEPISSNDEPIFIKDDEPTLINDDDDYLITPSTAYSPPSGVVAMDGKYEASTSTASTMSPGLEIVAMVIVWLINFVCLTFAGSPAALICGSRYQKGWLIFQMTFLILFTIWTYRRLSSSAVNAGRKHGWINAHEAVLYCGLSFFAGLAAALLGIGGGLIKGPLLIHIGLSPICAVATSNYMILFTSTTNLISYLLAGRLDFRHSFLFAPLAMIGGVMGVQLLRKHFSVPSRQQRLTYLLAWVIIAGATAMIGVNVRERVLNNGTSREQTIEQACHHLHIESDLTQTLLNFLHRSLSPSSPIMIE